MHGLLTKRGLRPPVTDALGKRGRQWLVGLSLPHPSRGEWSTGWRSPPEKGVLRVSRCHYGRAVQAHLPGLLPGEDCYEIICQLKPTP